MQYFISTSIECTTAEGVCEEEFWQKQNKVSQEKLSMKSILYMQ